MARHVGVWMGFTLIAPLAMSSFAGEVPPLAAADPARESTNVAASIGPRMPALEQAFWQCDYEATRQLLDPGTAAYCSAVTEELKKIRFGDDFASLLSWWEQNKASQHRRLASATR